MNALIKLQEIKTVPAIINFDFEGVKALVTAHLERFQNIVLTDDTVKDGKELIKEINSTRKALEDARKSEAKKASEPIKAFEANMKELVSLHDTLLDNLRVQIAQFENERKYEIRTAIAEFQKKEWLAQGVTPEFQTSQTDHLVLLGSFTAGGKLTAKVIGEIKQLVSNDKMLQQQTELRLSQLETLCYKAGLAAPLNKSHVSHFLLDDEVTYQTKLNALMAGELEREKQAIEFRKAKELREQQLQQAVEPAATELAATEPAVAAPLETEPVSFERNEQSTRVTITVSFTLDIPVSIGNEAIANSLDAKLKGHGFKTHAIKSVVRG